MKKIVVVGLLLALIGACCFAFSQKPQTVQTGAYLRMHIRADSNEAEAQAVKYQVRDRVVSFLTPVVAECETKEEAMKTLEGMLDRIECVAEEVLRANGFSYGAKASIRKESFPTRIYEEVTLEAGVYDALIIELGSGAGDNWWCVVYPPLCFAGGNGNITYKSKIAEIIERFFRK